jgi:hypothetical protein
LDARIVLIEMDSRPAVWTAGSILGILLFFSP